MDTTTKAFINGDWRIRPTLKAGTARKILALAEENGLDGPSKLSKSFGRMHAHEFLTGGLTSYPDDEEPINHIIAKNISIEFDVEYNEIAA